MPEPISEIEEYKQSPLQNAYLQQQPEASNSAMESSLTSSYNSADYSSHLTSQSPGSNVQSPDGSDMFSYSHSEAAQSRGMA